jgi:PhnB protein
MKIDPQLLFNGQCEEAFKFYVECLGGKILTMMPYAGSPAESHVPEAWRSKILHAALDLNGQVLMGADPPEQHYRRPQGFSLAEL